MLFRHELRALLIVALPIVVSQLGHVGMNTVDTIMVGPLGAEALAAVGIGSALHIFTLMLFTGTILGMTPLVSQAFGSGDGEACRRILVQALWLSAVLSAPLVVLTLEGEAIARFLGQRPETVVLAGEYMTALAWGVPSVLFFMALRQFLEGMGATAPAMVVTFVGLVVNIPLNAALMYGVEGWIAPLGIVGTGHATSVARWAMLGMLLAYLALHPRYRILRGMRWRPEGALLRRIVSIGAPIGGQLSMEVGLFSFAAVMVGWFGPVELAAHQVTINIASLTFMVALGVSLAGSIRVGLHIGGRSPRAIRRSVGATYLVSVGFMALCAVAFVLFSRELVGLYTSDPAIQRIGVSLLAVAAFFQVADGAQVAGLCSLRGAADTRVPLWIAMLGYWGIGVPVAYLLGFHAQLGPVGVWVGLCIALGVVAILLGWRVRRVLWPRVSIAGR